MSFVLEWPSIMDLSLEKQPNSCHPAMLAFRKEFAERVKAARCAFR